MFIDQLKLHLFAGKGGNGVVAWRREKFLPKGGPFGGNGGRGGSVIIEADIQRLSLEEYCHTPILKAENGHQGGSNRRQGKGGDDLIIKVPVGTIIKDAQTHEIIADLDHDKMSFLLCTGGVGGKGNAFFKSSINRAPNKSTSGKEGQTLEVDLEVKLIADIGFVGMPNAGKSTLLSSLTDVKVKVASYPFTTLAPNLATLEFEDFSKLFIADIPGIIQNAHKNKGLGISFLRHIERTSILIYVIDSSGLEGRDPFNDFEILQKELKEFNPELLKKPFLVVLNKVDQEEAKEHILNFKKCSTLPSNVLFEVSALCGIGLEKLALKMKEFAKWPQEG